MRYINKYYNPQHIRTGIEAGNQRALIGGMWDEIGQLQFDFVKKRGLSSNMRFLDVGCGCLRGGVHFINYLEHNHYYGIDISQELLDVGFDKELAQVGLQHKLSKNNLHCTRDFDATGFGVSFEMALALSVFTHLTINHIRLCLVRLADVMKPGGVFFATVFQCPDRLDWTKPMLQAPGNITTFPDRDPYHYRYSDLKNICRDLPWELRALEDWSHPRAQMMAHFFRTDFA